MEKDENESKNNVQLNTEYLSVYFSEHKDRAILFFVTYFCEEPDKYVQAVDKFVTNFNYTVARRKRWYNGDLMLYGISSIGIWRCTNNWRRMHGFPMKRKAIAHIPNVDYIIFAYKKEHWLKLCDQ